MKSMMKALHRILKRDAVFMTGKNWYSNEIDRKKELTNISII